jgi:hypothetical protein
MTIAREGTALLHAGRVFFGVGDRPAWVELGFDVGVVHVTALWQNAP